MKNVLAFDLGASSGRAVIGSFDGKKITLTEVHRFKNDPVELGGTLYWDVLRLWYEICEGLVKAKPYGYDCIGIDTWGVDFGLFDRKGRLLGNPVHYRDRRYEGMVAASEKYISNDELYGVTGIQFMDFNTVFQLIATAEKEPELLERADRLLLMPDMLNYFLTGEMTAEYTMASTTQLLDARTRRWSADVLSKMPFGSSLLPDIIDPGTRVGTVTAELSELLGIPRVPVYAVCGHDTASAMVAVPAKEKDFAFLSCGTWSLLGTELDEPVINADTRSLNMTNEGGYGGCISFLKNIIGLWLIQESRRQWKREGTEYSFAELEKLALAAPSGRCLIDPDDPVFVPQGDIPGRIREYCRSSGQPVPEDVGAVMRCIYESIAGKYASTVKKLEKCTGKTYDTLHVIGGGVKDGLLLKMTAETTGMNVVPGPIEATALGNVAVQLIAEGELKDIAQARSVI